MKFKDLVRFIESEVEQATKPAEEVKESTSEISPPVQQKPVTINIKREDKPKKERELEEPDFEEIMFHKLDESFLRNKIRSIISENIEKNTLTAQNNPIDGLGKKVRNKTLSYKIYNDSFTEAAQEAINLAKQRGYDVDENDWFTQVSTGPRKPNPGNTNRYSIELTKDGVLTKKYLHFQVYGMESGKYELNAYLSSK